MSREEETRMRCLIKTSTGLLLEEYYGFVAACMIETNRRVKTLVICAKKIIIIIIIIRI